MSSSQNTTTRTKSRRRSDKIPWMCGGDSEVEVVLPNRYTRPPQELVSETVKQQKPSDVQGRRHQLYRSVSTAILQPRRTSGSGQSRRSRGSLRSCSPARKHGSVNNPADGISRDRVTSTGRNRRQSCDFDEKKREQAEVLRLAASTASSFGLKEEYSNSAYHGHNRLRKSQSVGATSIPRRSSIVVDASSTTEQGGHHAAENKPPTESSFNMALGAALLSLYSRSAAEFSRLESLRKDTEVLLNKIQDAVARLENISVDPAGGAAESRKLSEPAVKTCSPTTSSDSAASAFTVDKNISTDFCPQTSVGSVPSCNRSKGPTLAHDHPDAYADSDVEDSETRMFEQMEAELESELGRLELTMAAYHHAGDPTTGLQEPGKSAAMPWSNCPDHEPSRLIQENQDDDERHHQQCHGVCPYKLERRLRDLLETRQQEYCIEDLELAPITREWSSKKRNEDLWARR